MTTAENVEIALATLEELEAALRAIGDKVDRWFLDGRASEERDAVVTELSTVRRNVAILRGLLERDRRLAR